MERGLYETFMIEGLNLDRALNSLIKKGVKLYKIKKKSQKCITLTIEMRDNEKFFAYFKDMCYNITKIKEGGALYPFYFLKKRVGVLIGLIMFIAVMVCGNNLILGIDYSGTGTQYAYEAENILKNSGVKKFAFLSGDLTDIADKILAESGHFSFASVKKCGSRVKVELVKATEAIGGIDTSRGEIVATKAGVIESVKTYRGTQKVKVNDYVEIGAVLVSGKVIIKEQEYVTYALADITIITSFTYIFNSEEDNMENIAEIFAKESLGDFTVTSVNTSKEANATGFSYTVNLKYRVKI